MSTGKQRSSPKGAPSKRLWPVLTLQQQRLRVLYQFLDAHQEADGFRAVYDAVVVGEGEVHHRADPDLAVDDHRALLDLLTHQEAAALRAVYDAVVVGEGEVHHRADPDLAVDDHRALLDLVHPQDGYLRHGEDRRREQAPEDTAVSDGERPAGEVLKLELALAGLDGEGRYPALYLGEALAVRVAHAGDDEPLARRAGPAPGARRHSAP